jgi:glutamate carboxypeptidase
MAGLPAVLPGAALDVRRITWSPPLEAASSAGLFALAERICADQGLRAPTGVAVGGASDGNHIAALGVATLDGLGAVGGGAHTLAEHVFVDELPRSAALLAGLITATLAAS